ncbi:MAG: DNA primase [Desulfobacterales bacterium]|nr:DNA primase [Desulfobacterales bacterium]
MAIYIPEDKLAEIRNTTDIVDVVSERVALKKTGKDYTGLCPFHSEKTPSFTVSSTKQIFYCFGCGAGGDVFNFLIRFEGISFPEAAQSLARQCGIELPTRHMSASEKQAVSEREKLFDINKKVLAYYRNQLLRQPAGEKARAYLENRGFSREIIDRFGLGYAPEGWDNLIRLFRKEQIPVSLAEKAGLIVPRSSKTGYYDRFRNRIMFPIVDATRRIIAFGGRVLDDATPKYLNSPETPIYSKSSSLYGIHAAREKCRETGIVYIVEGYFDILAMHQHGIANSVATLGTSLTTGHIRMLRRGYAKKARLVFDSDTAGIKAAHRSIGLFMNESVDVEIIVLPAGEDPDSFLFAHGADAFFEYAEAARGAIEFLMESAISAHGLSMQGKIRVVDELKQPLADIRDSVARSIYIRHLAERLGVDESAILERVRAARKQQDKAPQKKRPISQNSGTDTAEKPALVKNRLEARMVAMMLQYPEIVPSIENQQITDYFEDIQLKELAELILSHPPKSTDDISELLNRIPDNAQRQLVASLAMGKECWDETSCEKLVAQFKGSWKRRHQELLDQIKAAEQNKDHELLFKLLKEKQKQAIKTG